MTFDKSFAEKYTSGTPRRVDWATLAESVTIRHFRSEDFPVGQDSSAIWEVYLNSFDAIQGWRNPHDKQLAFILPAG